MIGLELELQLRLHSKINFLAAVYQPAIIFQPASAYALQRCMR